MLDAAAMEYRGEGIGLSGSDLIDVLDPRRIVETRTAVGGAAPEVVEEMAASCLARAHELATTAQRNRASFRSAEDSLVARARAMADHAGPGPGPRPGQDHR
jgi:argininosuccinate lyase